MYRRRLGILFIGLLWGTVAARADIALLLEEPFGQFGGMTPTGHAAIYLSRVCAASPVSLRRCNKGEPGAVISRYHRVGGYDWLAIPVIPYLYAVDRAEQIPREVGENDVASLRDDYRRRYLGKIAPDTSDGFAPEGDWIQLVGAAYDRTTYTYELETSEEQDDKLIQVFNSGDNETTFRLLFHNCADFARELVNFYYPKAIHRSIIADVGIMTPKQAAKSLVRYGKRHPSLQISSFVIPQVPGTVERSRPVRGVLEALVKTKKYILPLAPLALIHPYFGGGLVVAWIQGGRFNPRSVAGVAGSEPETGMIARLLQPQEIAAPVIPPAD
ncbi:MAG: hypothetical protein ABI833_13805 [Acidobacteriota bacterium]